VRKPFGRALMLACVGLLAVGYGDAFGEPAPRPEPAPQRRVLGPEPFQQRPPPPPQAATTHSSPSTSGRSSSSWTQPPPASGEASVSGSVRQASTPRTQRTAKPQPQPPAQQRQKTVSRPKTESSSRSAVPKPALREASSRDEGLLLVGGLLLLGFLVGDALFLANARLALTRDGD
jgi:hypothetical protein